MRIELNLTLRCNQRCHNCNRLCHLFPERTDDVSLEQIKTMLEQLKSKGLRCNRMKVVGGEPLLHPQFVDAWSYFCVATETGLIEKIKIDTNGTIPIPDWLRNAYGRIRFSTSKPRSKAHVPYLWSPADLGYDLTGPGDCTMPRICGLSLDNRGWLPCSAAIMIARGFGLEHLYRQEVPEKTWGLDELCRHCVHAMPKEWKDRYCKKLSEITVEERTPTVSWGRALEKLGYNK